MRKPFLQITARLTGGAVRVDQRVRRSGDPHNVFAREPVLIPKLFVDLTPPWYRHHPTVVLAIVLFLLAATIGGLVARYGVEGVLRGYARLVG